MSRSSSLDLTQSHEVAALEVAGTMSELPQGRVRGPCVEYIADCTRLARVTAHDHQRGLGTFVKAVHVELPDKR